MAIDLPSEAISISPTILEDHNPLTRRREMMWVLILAGVQFSHIMDFVLMMPLGPQLMRVLKIQVDQFSILISVYTFAAAFSCLSAALFMDRFDRKNVLITIYAGLVLGTLLCGLTTSYEGLIAARMVTGVFGGLLQAIILSILGDLIPQERRGQATGIVMAAFAVSSVIGVPIGLALAQRFEWNWAFIGLAGLSCLNLFFAWIQVPNLKKHLMRQRSHSIFKEFFELLTQFNTLISILLIISMMSIFALFPFISTFLVQTLSISESQLPVIYAVGGVATIFAAPTIGRLCDRFGPRNIFILCSLLSIVTIPFFTTLETTSMTLAIVLYTILSAVGVGRMTPSMDLISRSVADDQRGSFMTLIAGVQQLAASAASYGGGMLLGGIEGMKNFGTIGLIVVISMIISIGLSLLFRPVRKSGLRP